MVPSDPKIIILISANIEWGAMRALFPKAQMQISPYGEWFIHDLGEKDLLPVLFFHGSWGKIAAAASTQYAIDRWSPELLVNLGTCGGFLGQIERGEVLLVERTLVYDIIEQMGDFDEHIEHYTTDIDLSWLGDPPYPQTVRRSLLVSGDRDLVVEDIPDLKALYGAVAGDWESGAIAFVAARNGVRLLILRGVTDLVGGSGGEAYGNIEFFTQETQNVMAELVSYLPAWLRRARFS